MLQTLLHVIFLLLPLSALGYNYRTYQGEDCRLSNSTRNGTCMETEQCNYIQKKQQTDNNLQLCKAMKTGKKLTCCPNLPSNQGDSCYIWGHIGPNDKPRYPNVAGKCIPLEECESAKSLLQFQKREDTCFSNDKIECCPLQEFPQIKTIADEKCAKYYEVSVGSPEYLGYGGTLALPKELPHMAAIGYEENEETTWFCGGSVISEHFIVSAAHCTSFHGHTPNIVRLGDLTLDGHILGSSEYTRISQIYRHPDYKFSSHYHDIALLELYLGAHPGFFKPICLHTENEISFELEAAGWGATENSSRSNHLLKISLNVTDYKDCAPKFSNVSKRKLKNGIINDLQICAGGLGHDTCTGDSGGPLHYKVPGNVLTGHKHFVLAGVVSFGKGCGELGVYTRVSAYVSWIESIVWPSIDSEEIIENVDNFTLVNSTDEIIFYQSVHDSRSGVFSQYEGDSCILQKSDSDSISKNGTCINIHKCDYAKELLRRSMRPRLCSFSGKDPIICCSNKSIKR